jgi:hypothetical protein
MSLALASRGYLCTRVNIIAPVDPPAITSSEVDAPRIGQAGLREDAPPKIVGAATGQPTIRGATEDQQPVTTGKPSVTSAATDSPTIRSAKKD